MRARLIAGVSVWPFADYLASGEPICGGFVLPSSRRHSSAIQNTEFRVRLNVNAFSHVVPGASRKGSLQCHFAAASWIPGLLCFCWLGVLSTVAAAQPVGTAGGMPRSSVSWVFVVDGVADPSIRPQVGWSADSVAVAARTSREELMARGYWYAQVDSVVSNDLREGVRLAVFLSAGEPVRIESISTAGFSAIDSLAIRSRFTSRRGDVLSRMSVEEDLALIAGRYNARGYGLAEVRSELTMAGDSMLVNLKYIVKEGSPILLADIELAPEIRSGKRLISRYAGHAIGRTLEGFDAEVLRADLVRSGLYSEVGTPELRMRSDGEAVLSVPLIEASPGSFDLVIGYLPGVSGGRGSVVGNGRLKLVNLFGGGRSFSVKLNRLPGQTSTVDVAIADPFIAGLPIGLSLAFDGEQRDSTYGKQRYAAGLSYQVLDDLSLSANVLKETTRPGQAGVNFLNGQQRIARADAVLAGVGVTYSLVDNTINPRRGFSFASNFERGAKQSTQRSIIDADTTTTRRSFRQERLQVAARGYVPLTLRQVVAIGADASLLRTDQYDQSDLLRIGGAASLRGYNEEQFSGRFVGRWLFEYRYLLERNSFAYLFADIGVVERPDTDEDPATTTVYPGYGIGLQFETGIGVVNATYALNRDDGPTNGKIHVGLSFAL